MSERIMPNRCAGVRGEIDGKAHRILSFFHDHPSKTDMSQWTILELQDHTYIVDKLTLEVMAQCECECLSKTEDQSYTEPAIVAVRLTEKKDGI